MTALRDVLISSATVDVHVVLAAMVPDRLPGTRNIHSFLSNDVVILRILLHLPQSRMQWPLTFERLIPLRYPRVWDMYASVPPVHIETLICYLLSPLLW